MSKKRNKEFKEKLLNNKVKTEERKEVVNSKSIVMVDIKEKNLLAKVDRKDLFVDSREVKELIRDIFYTNVQLKEDSIIRTDDICDVCYRLNYKGMVNDEALFVLC